MNASPSDIGRTAAMQTIQTRAIEYEYDGAKMQGFLAYDDAVKGKRPGILVFPEWWGLNEYAKTHAKQLAEFGYVAFAADLNGDGEVIEITHPEEAAMNAGALRANPKTWRGRATAAFMQLTAQPNVDASKIAAIGYCLDTAFQPAYTGADLKAVATFHSALPTPTDAEARAIQAKVLVCLGAADTFIPEKAIKDFRAALDAAGVSLDFITYEGVVHSFTSPSADRVGNPGMKYDKDADEDSWRRMKELFAATFA